jgi:hypothetical protein
MEETDLSLGNSNAPVVVGQELCKEVLLHMAQCEELLAPPSDLR